jgi:hypothetical protein
VPQRREPRFAADRALSLEGGEARARNVSASGIYLETKLPLKAGDDLRFTVLVFQEMSATLRMHCRARVVRADALEGCYGIGAAIRELRLDRIWT